MDWLFRGSELFYLGDRRQGGTGGGEGETPRNHIWLHSASCNVRITGPVGTMESFGNKLVLLYPE